MPYRSIVVYRKCAWTLQLGPERSLATFQKASGKDFWLRSSSGNHQRNQRRRPGLDSGCFHHLLFGVVLSLHELGKLTVCKAVRIEVLCWKIVYWSLHVGRDSLSKAEGVQGHRLVWKWGYNGTWDGQAVLCPVMQELCQTAVVKMELNRKVKLSIYKSIYVPTLRSWDRITFCLEVGRLGKCCWGPWCLEYPV